MRACYMSDLAGTLIFIPDPFEQLSPNGWPRGSAEAELLPLFPRATSTTQALKTLLAVIRRAFTPPPGAMGIRDGLSSCYPDGRPQIHKMVFFPYVGASEPDDYYAEVIREVDAAAGNPAAQQAERLLAKYGVHRIPPLSRFSTHYHEGETPEGTPIKETISSGWVRDGRVLLKAKVSTIARTS